MDPTGWTWYCNVDDIEKLSPTESPAEILWRGERAKSLSLEEDNFPPTLYGNGRINPTQNLVDAFPMLNGYPVSHLSGEYDENLPYANRDPRLEAYILYNGCKAGNTNKEIFTAADGTTNDALNKVVGRSTRTGYYLRKLLRQDISLDRMRKPTSIITHRASAIPRYSWRMPRRQIRRTVRKIKEATAILLMMW